MFNYLPEDLINTIFKYRPIEFLKYIEQKELKIFLNKINYINDTTKNNLIKYFSNDTNLNKWNWEKSWKFISDYRNINEYQYPKYYFNNKCKTGIINASRKHGVISNNFIILKSENNEVCVRKINIKQCFVGKKYYRKFERPPIKKITCGNYHAAMITGDKKLCLFGDNDKLQLGVTNISKAKSWTILNILKKNTSMFIEDVECGGNFTAIKLNNRKFFITGNLLHQNFSLKKENTYLSSLKISAIFCGYAIIAIKLHSEEILTAGFQSFFLTREKKIFNLDKFEKIIIPKNRNVLDMKFGFGCGLILTTCGKIYATGRMAYSEKNKFKYKKIKLWKKIKLKEKIIQIIFNDNYFLLLTKKNKVFVSIKNYPTEWKELLIPDLSINDKIIFIISRVWFITQNGKIFKIMDKKLN